MGAAEAPQPSLGSVAIVGAGASGLAAAYRLKSAGVAVTVFEADARIGGKLQSVSEDGFIWEKGANTMMENDYRVSNMIDDLNLRSKQQLPNEQKKRYIVRDGAPLPLPSNPVAFVTSKLFSSEAKRKVLMEPFLWRKREANSVDEDESVGSFMDRHFGREVVKYAVDPFLAGTSGSDPDSLSMRYSLPDLWALEKSHGSLLVGAIKRGFSKKREPRPRVKGSFSFRGGLQTLANALMCKIGEDSLKLNSLITGLACSQQGNPSRSSWKLTVNSGPKQKKSQQFFDAVVMTAPLNDLRAMSVVKDGKPYELNFLPKMVYEPMSVLVTWFRKDNVRRPLAGFGVLVPSNEQANGFQTLGTIFSSSMFPDRAPPGHDLFTTFIGGSRNMQLAAASKEKLLQTVCKDLEALLGIDSQPIASRHVYWEKAFPRYTFGYEAVLSSITKLEKDLPGLFCAGNQRGGLAVGKAIVSGLDAADQVLQYINSSGASKVYTMA